MKNLGLHFRISSAHRNDQTFEKYFFFKLQFALFLIFQEEKRTGQFVIHEHEYLCELLEQFIFILMDRNRVEKRLGIYCQQLAVPTLSVFTFSTAE